MNMISPRACPECKRDDKVEKVSVIYERGQVTTTTSYRYGVEEIRGNTTQLSSLARRLAPPAPPASSPFKNAVVFSVVPRFWAFSSYFILDVKYRSGQEHACRFSGLFTGGIKYPIVVVALVKRKKRKKQTWLAETAQQKREEYEIALDCWKRSFFASPGMSDS